MTQTMNHTASAKLDEGAQALFRQLATDEKLRHQLETDPVATLQAFGLEIDPADVPDQVVLPSVEELNKAAAEDTFKMWAPLILGD